MSRTNRIKQLFSEVFQLLNGEDTTTTSDEMTSLKLQDGTEIKVSKLEIGGTVMIGDAPAAAGDYTLEDGGKLVVDATGVITEYTPAVTEPVEGDTLDMSKPEQMRKLYDKFATGTPEERIANLETIGKALMEYSFGWQIKEAQEKVSRDAAIKVYADSLKVAQTQLAAHEKANKLMFEALKELAEMPSDDIPEQKKTFSFSNTETKGKSLQKFSEALKILNGTKSN